MCYFDENWFDCIWSLWAKGSLHTSIVQAYINIVTHYAKFLVHQAYIKFVYVEVWDTSFEKAWHPFNSRNAQDRTYFLLPSFRVSLFAGWLCTYVLWCLTSHAFKKLIFNNLFRWTGLVVFIECGDGGYGCSEMKKTTILRPHCSVKVC